jgi:polyphenol oxidase
MFTTPGIFQHFSNVTAAESTRHGGVSQGPYTSLNLGKNTDDLPEAVVENRRRFCQALGYMPEQMAWSKQVHGSEVRVVTAPGGAEGFDALITNKPGILLAVSVADCTPILVYDAKNKAVAAIHAGWRGTVAGILTQTLQNMQAEYGTNGADCHAYIGTCISVAAFEVGNEVADAFAPPHKRFVIERNRYFVDLKSANKEQLVRFRMPEHQIQISDSCTVQHLSNYFSHRADRGITGRMLAVIGLKTP